ncbi:MULTISPECIES: cobaltochelatase subunit CobN [Brucella]|uniref:Cobaltochelatase subunit CobN n=1 Tax=Brucella lupini TaxID=255457 RepID=A0A256GXG9_9HYPH|nr:MULTISPECIES: cobaltochelatase subunit CobN [Brucella]RNL43340.1 cobaltochelatase subunit CobN [Ochrobactrum sp. MH181795]KAB2700610.1 cobaltochelatase subunit CobN [Brucella lupini]KAB2728602.1 cobaltochelatase subunit CobN [Brucella anthropi]KAB2745775.1 cobaltochelatase subunit CobN [Brucella anthropi]KAB2800537.1 cobaltochelatase subunit CobN [Brucella anthropi]
MHLLLAQKGTISDGNEAVDLGQTPGEILFLSAADTELASLAQAHRLAPDLPSLRLANFLSLTHPMSVDAYVERTVRYASLIVVRIIGGETYWPYGLEALHACALNHGIKIAVLPGDDKPDHGLDRFSTISAHERNELWQYLIEGGAVNAGAFLHYCAALIAGSEKPESAAPLLKAGLWWPGEHVSSLDSIRTHWSDAKAPVAGIIFYRALVQSGQTQPVDALIAALQAKGLNPLPIFVSSLKDRLSAAVVDGLIEDCPLDIVLNATGFAISSPGAERKPTVLDKRGNMVLQVIFSGTPKAVWETSQQGMLARDLAMNVALPEVDGRVLSRAVSFKSAKQFDSAVEANIVTHEPHENRVGFVAQLAANWARLKRKSPNDRRVALILANYPNRDGRLGNGVGLDTPAGTVEVLHAMAKGGYPVADLPVDGDALMRALTAGPTNAARDGREIRETISLNQYKVFFKKLPIAIQKEIEERWGAPEDDPYFAQELVAFALPLMRLGETFVGIQPARGYNIDPKETYHSPDLVPPHGYIAFYAFLREVAGIDAIVHMGKHGNLEWLPGKALALSENCYPEAVFGPTPHIYPFIVNDPGEGTQAKRRASAVIIDHLTPPLTRAESYGPLKDLEALVDEYYEASGVDPRRLLRLKGQILDLVRDIGLDRDAGIHDHDDEDMALQKLDAYLCDLKEMQIRDGLHIFGLAPEGRLLTDLLVALARVPRGVPVSLGGAPGDQSLQRAIAADCGLGETFDPLDCNMAEAWTGAKPELLLAASPATWRIAGDTVERIELLAASFVAGAIECPADWPQAQAVLQSIEEHLRPMVVSCGPSEIGGFLAALGGRFVPPGPSGAPTRGRPDVLPTGRNFFSTDSRAVPTPAAWELGRKSAELLITRYTQDHGEWPTSFGLTAWGTSNMRTGGDDIAQALALIGVKPVWDMASRRVTGYEIVPIAKLGRPRVDVTLRISGFFRDAFPEQIALFDKAVRAVGALDEDAEDNPIAARMRIEQARLVAEGADEKTAERRAGYRVFGAKPGAYGAGLQALIDENGWAGRNDLAEAWLVWGGYAYGAGEEGQAERGLLEEQLRSVQAVVQNQDNREHDLLDSDDYYQFEGGMAATVESLSGAMPAVYHNDHSRPEKPVIRALEEELSRVVRGRAANPKWIAGVMRHGYKGAAEIAATVDYLFAFAATTGKVGNHHFEAVYQAYIADKSVHDFMAEKNPAALAETAAKLNDAILRGFWTPRSNSARFELETLSSNLQKLNPERAVNG